MTVVGVLGIVFGKSVHSFAAEYHVDVNLGDDAASGLAADSAWKHLQSAVSRVAPGDTVLVHPGIYHEHVKLERAGTQESPIMFRALREPGARCRRYGSQSTHPLRTAPVES